MKIDGVVGVGTTARGGQAALLVLVERSGVRGIPARADSIRVIIMVTGAFNAIHHRNGHTKGGGGSGESGGSGGGGVDTTARFARPIPIGVSVGNQGECSAGTVGARLTDGPRVFGISNNHVWGLENAAEIGVPGVDDTNTDTMLQPGRYDTACSTDLAGDSIGVLYDFVPMYFDGTPNQVDAAIALIHDGALGCSMPADGYGAPAAGVEDLALVGDSVKKYGRTTQQTTGTVISTDINVNVGHSSGTALFVNQILVDGGKGGFLNAGDSGSLLVLVDAFNTPTGLLFAGARGGKLAIANHIGEVLSEFSCRLNRSMQHKR